MLVVKTRLWVCTEVVILQQDRKSPGGFTLLGNMAPSAASALLAPRGHGGDGCGRDVHGAHAAPVGRNEHPGAIARCWKEGWRGSGARREPEEGYQQ